MPALTAELGSLPLVGQVTAHAPSACRNEAVAACTRLIAESFAAALPRGIGRPLHDVGEAEACRSFESWCEAHGVSTMLEVRDFEGTGRGMAATRDIQAGSIGARCTARPRAGCAGTGTHQAVKTVFPICPAR